MAIASDPQRLAELSALAYRLGVAALPAFCRRNGIAPGPELAVLRLTIGATQGQPGTTVDPASTVPDGEPMPPLAVRYAAAAEALDVSERTVKRLVATGALPTIEVGGSKRIPVSELDAFVRRQLEAA